MTDTGGVENPQPAIRGPQSSGQPPSRPPTPDSPTRPAGGPGPRPSAGPGPRPAPGEARPTADWATFVESCKQLADRIASIRQVRWIRKSSASVRWVLLVAAVGLGSALLIALTVSILVSLIPRSG